MKELRIMDTQKDLKSIQKLVYIAFFIFLFVLNQAAHSQFKAGTGLEANNYELLEIDVEDLHEFASQIGLTRQRLLDRIFIRARQLGITPSLVGEKEGYLYLNLNVVGDSFNLTLKYIRAVQYTVTDQKYFGVGTTWNVSTTGIHGGSSQYIIDTLDGHLDRFFNEYLAANEQL
jgi:hypothetical protein